MDLKFIWIKEHRAIKDLNFNFCHSGVHQFHYDGKKIITTENPINPISFSKNVTSLTAIVGKNGSGKSSFCEAVLYATATLQENSFGLDALFDGIVCFDDALYLQQDLQLDNEIELSSLGYRVIRFNESPFEEEMDRRFAEGYLGHLGFVYYSNSSDLKGYVDVNNLSNISSSFRMVNDHYYNCFVVHSNFEVFNKRFGDCYSQQNIYISQEHYRILNFILNFPEFSDFEKHKIKVGIFPSYSGNNKYLNYSINNKSLSEYIEHLEEGIFNEIIDYYPKKHQTVKIDSNKFKSLIHRLYRLNIVLFFAESHNLEIEDVRNLIYKDIIPKKLLDFKIRELLNCHQELIDNCLFNEYLTVHEGIHNEVNCKDWRFYVLSQFFVYLNEQNQFYLKNLISLESENFNKPDPGYRRMTNFGLFSFFSGGELSHLSLFSRIYDVIEAYKEGRYHKTELALFIDEPDSEIHPNWCKEFISKLLHLLDEPFNPFKIQLILTTHSPYILSDLPKENIRLFNRENHEPPKIDESKSNTFGANIYDLMHDSFFMSDGFIGSFAQEKIDSVFHELSSKIDNEMFKMKMEKNEIKSIIEIIGEPLIQRQLSALYDRVFNEDMEADIITRQIQVLEKLRDRKTNKSK